MYPVAMSHSDSRLNRALNWYADLLTNRPGRVLMVLVALTALSGWAASHLRINSNQLDLISQDLQEVPRLEVADLPGGEQDRQGAEVSHHVQASSLGQGASPPPGGQSADSSLQ